VREPAPR